MTETPEATIPLRAKLLLFISHLLPFQEKRKESEFLSNQTSKGKKKSEEKSREELTVLNSSSGGKTEPVGVGYGVEELCSERHGNRKRGRHLSRCKRFPR